MLVAQDTQHGVEVAVSPLHRVGLWIVRRREGESDTGPLESLLHRLGPEVRGVVRVNLQGITKPRIDCLKGPQYLFAGRVAEGYGFEPLAEDVFQCEQVPVAFRTGAQGSQHIHTPDLKGGASLNTRAVNVLLYRGLLALHLTGMAVL